MNSERLKERLIRGDRMIGFAITYPAPGIIENIGSDWDFLWLDGQHGQIFPEQMLSMVRTAELLGVDSLLRVPGHELGVIGPYLDMMPTALMLPMINTATDAERAVNATRFAPLGSRSFGGRRPVDRSGRSYHKTHEPVLVAQIESPQALQNANEIAQAEGIDVLMLGPDDLKLSLGLNIDATVLGTPVLREAMKTVAHAAAKAGKHFCCITPNSEIVQLATELDCQMLIGGGDSGVLRQGSLNCSDMLQQALGNTASEVD